MEHHQILDVISLREITTYSEILHSYIVLLAYMYLVKISKFGTKIWNCKICGCPIVHGRSQYNKITAIDMYIYFLIKGNVHIQSHWNYIEPIEVEKLKLYA